MPMERALNLDGVAVMTEQFLHYLATDVAGNSCGCIRAKLQHIYVSSLEESIHLDNPYQLATKLDRIFDELVLHLGWPINRQPRRDIACGNAWFYRPDHHKRIFSVARQAWETALSKKGSRCGAFCRPGGCPDWVVLCAYQDALRIHIQQWLDSLSPELDSSGHPDSLYFVYPASILSDIWALEFLAIIFKDPKLESLVQSLRTAVEDWFCGGEQSVWNAAIPENWHMQCTYWRGHDHGLDCQL
ncbi:hypothetical protein PFICI_05935 [Pestalotiopsis fici W106-1]|uniref:Uncharacterized protein n=1 Tax=Pestalotiopsis fici (strain W106-1 / CGMCC3.15140) TaxID=1229662 RepID=W3XDG4_PESFW|nr:uncharacterized protein PFICI_05935 [Pestalotiopsis fici W106-1]ETS84059.1 hypothetical protein PFICI_05935 [Pestalotiopsis fici W106-1]